MRPYHTHTRATSADQLHALSDEYSSKSHAWCTSRCQVRHRIGALSWRQQPCRRLLRSAADRTCVIPNNFGDRSFSTAGQRVWNSLPSSSTQNTSYEQFNLQLKTFCSGTSWSRRVAAVLFICALEIFLLTYLLSYYFELLHWVLALPLNVWSPSSLALHTNLATAHKVCKRRLFGCYSHLVGATLRLMRHVSRNVRNATACLVCFHFSRVAWPAFRFVTC